MGNLIDTNSLKRKELQMAKKGGAKHKTLQYLITNFAAGFPFGFPCGICHLKHQYKGKTDFRELKYWD